MIYANALLCTHTVVIELIFNLITTGIESLLLIRMILNIFKEVNYLKYPKVEKGITNIGPTILPSFLPHSIFIISHYLYHLSYSHYGICFEVRWNQHIAILLCK